MGNSGRSPEAAENMGAPLGSCSQCKSTHLTEQLQALLEKLVKTKPCRHWEAEGGTWGLIPLVPQAGRKDPVPAVPNVPGVFSLPLLHDHSQMGY